ncbi:aspartate--ammonia ligase [Spirochaeta africana]|uniref:Aspartate--ammonia ligase n=1 Tax=Spirochaeta africana (strain ATCC 700263 / DSM 8902 / Z-7692) TaxID=889378 RepID=H9UIR3_SPIAZ|nr:aspartate--ammonia ligase [Spirochaeta africana]AFG37406.1 aspartate--ammonia ligase, AsnA-type [Spirochaeta africana DSM 8902]
MQNIPSDYRPLLNVQQTERAIKQIKDYFERSLSAELRLFRVTSPLFVPAGSGINDDLNGIERPVSFPVAAMEQAPVEIVQSLAKWKRMALADYGYRAGTGIYTDMNAIRPDDTIDAIHSIYVDQWDWEMVLAPRQRNLEMLKQTVRRIYAAIVRTEFVIHEQYPEITPCLPEEITFVHAEDALQRYPRLTPEQREYELAREHGAIFVIGIGGQLSDGRVHGGRAPDYDDWTTETAPGYAGLNGDIVVWDPVRQNSLELSSMGIRVDDVALLRQLELTGTMDRRQLYWHTRLLQGELPQTIGGGIGQSRLCMFLLRKAHIGEVQASVWPDTIRNECMESGVQLM